MQRCRRAALTAACCVLAVAVQAAALDRPLDPVIMTGADILPLNGILPDELVAFRYDGAWRQIPIQVDERALIDFTDVYHGDTWLGDFVRLDYVDTSTFTGPDPSPVIDSDDEIVVMAKDAGHRYTGVSGEPPHTVPGSGLEITVTDPLGGTPAYLYLFQQDGTLDPAAGLHYVEYDFYLLSGDYKTTYNLNTGPNPEDSSVATPYYARHFPDRWKTDALHIYAGGATGVNILDRHKNLFSPGHCNRSENSFANGEGAFIINKSGPVRAIRTYLGANSGPRTQRQHIFYAQREDITAFLRVHDIPGIMDFFDYAPAASGMIYRNNNFSTGAVIDGIPDTVPDGLLLWEMVSGPQGTLIMTHELTANFTGLTPGTYYLDDTTPPVTQCTGDPYAYGSSGTWVNQDIPNTDPFLFDPHEFSLHRTIYYLPPATPPAAAPNHDANARHPLTVAATPWNPSKVEGLPLTHTAGIASLAIAFLILMPRRLQQG